MDFQKLLVRTLSGLVYIAIIIGCCLWGQMPLAVMASVMAVLAVLEFEKITEGAKRNPLVFAVDAAGCVTLCYSWMIWPLALWMAIMLLRMTLELYSKNEKPVKSLALSMMTQIYIGMPLAAMCLLSDWFDARFVLIVFAMIWINDTGAFLTGSLTGRHKLFERISPKKTWEGYFGGMAFNILAGWGCYALWNNSYGYLIHGLGGWILLGILVTVFATWGDLVESMVKRSLHIKDSGNLIPGHGGILDRIDSMLFVMPAVYLYVILTIFIF